MHQNTGVAMIRMIIVRPRGQHDIRIPAANLTDDFLTHLQCWKQLPVMIVQYFILDPQPPRRFLRFAEPALGQSGALRFDVQRRRW